MDHTNHKSINYTPYITMYFGEYKNLRKLKRGALL